MQLVFHAKQTSNLTKCFITAFSQHAGVIFTQIFLPNKNSFRLESISWMPMELLKRQKICSAIKSIWFKPRFKNQNEEIFNLLEKYYGKIGFWKFYVADSTADHFLLPLQGLHRHPTNGFWRHFCRAKLFKLIPPRHTVYCTFL